jgi:hypothetical protein
VSGTTDGVEDSDEEVEDEREEDGLIFERCSVAKRGREILGRPSPQYARWMCTSSIEERMTASGDSGRMLRAYESWCYVVCGMGHWT